MEREGGCLPRPPLPLTNMAASERSVPPPSPQQRKRFQTVLIELLANHINLKPVHKNVGVAETAKFLRLLGVCVNIPNAPTAYWLSSSRLANTTKNRRQSASAAGRELTPDSHSCCSPSRPSRSALSEARNCTASSAAMRRCAGL